MYHDITAYYHKHALILWAAIGLAIAAAGIARGNSHGRSGIAPRDDDRRGGLVDRPDSGLAVCSRRLDCDRYANRCVATSEAGPAPRR